mmetsp:Transcript_15800/g.34200  ORF Transcript_15800/g.34200 Transcript_15800/m.34200 type:complete len:388 (-) Transcript_15800:144-1307(-)|eukprot:CAMPEP_0172312440 /NCGR_PEP_ID=MMETSP1058-20130122/17517_1 /TAXON_ID=83371 /ORGANISM="Detonula confervacea, Strain CCMP 353" /LENGTH=387 /DNA_ID=CAMNT_0013025897 /DNA_START=24 /DNA_END=1187 /DNA_ORIENTATION=-
MTTMMSAQTRLDHAILAHEQAEAEVERLCDILERAADALNQARQTKRSAQKELDLAAKAARASSLHHRASVGGQQTAVATLRTQATSATAASTQPPYSGRVDPGGRAPAAAANGNNFGQGYRREEAEHYAEDDRSESSDDEEYSDSEESDEEDDEEDGFDMGNEALEQVRYRLETAKIDANSPEGTKLLDELLIRLQNSKEEVIDAQLVNEFIDGLLCETDEQTSGTAEQKDAKPPPQNPKHSQYPRVRISRGGKVLGWYQGQLDERGYARQGSGSMYYDGGHECHGTFQNDEMIGRGIYQWSDGHVYDGEWLNGKRHGLGRFIRPDNVVLYGRYEKGHHKGNGVRWSADRRESQLVVDGVPKKTVSLAKAKEIATNLGFDDVLPPV